MKKDIPLITFNSATTDNFGFEIISIEKNARNKETYKRNPELPYQ